MNDIVKIFENPQFGKIRIAGTSDNPLFCLADVCNAVNLTNPSQIKARLDASDVQLVDLHALNSLRVGNAMATFVTENGFYDIIIYSNSSKVKPFRKWVMSEVLPSIRKYGAYMTDKTIEKALNNPDFLIQLATRLKESKERCEKLEAENIRKEQVIEGLVDEIPLADMRQRVTQIVRKAGDWSKSYRLLYQEFNLKFHINVYTRMNNVCYKEGAMDYIEKELGMMPQLYDLACKLFENSYEALMKSWGLSAKRADLSRNIDNRNYRIYE